MRKDNVLSVASAVTSKVRYSDKELEEFQQIILDKLDKARRDLEILNENVRDSDDTSSREENYRLAVRQEKFILNLENALVRIKNKTYGICRVTGELISKERLCSVPHATLSVAGKITQNTKDKKTEIQEKFQSISNLLDKKPTEVTLESTITRW